MRGRARYGSVRASYYNAATAAVEYVQAGDDEPTFVIRDPRPDAPQAKADAEAKLLELHRRTGALELTLAGNPALVAESPLQTDRLGGNVDGPWMVGGASNAIAGRSGYTTELYAETAPPAGRPDTKTIATGPQPVGGSAIGAGGGGRGGSSSGRGGGGIPSVPDLRRVVERAAAQYPVDDIHFVPDVVHALRAEGGPRWGFFRGSSGNIATDAVGYYLGEGPVNGSADVAIVVVRIADTPRWIPASQHVGAKPVEGFRGTRGLAFRASWLRCTTLAPGCPTSRTCPAWCGRATVARF